MTNTEVVNLIVTPLALGTFGFLARYTFAGIDVRFKQAADRLDRHENRMDRSDGKIEELRDCKVEKEDWLRESAIGRRGQECILQKLTEMKGTNDLATEIGAALKLAIERQDRHE